MSGSTRAAPALFGLGFRPFYLGAALFAVFGMITWSTPLFQSGVSAAYLSALAWHSHEMLFGFATAVMAGFLLTAVRNWTGIATPTGLPLAAMAILWLAARLLVLTGQELVAVIVDVVFLPVLMIVIALPIVRSRNKRNYKLLLVVMALALSNISFHLGTSGIVSAYFVTLATTIGMDVFLVLLAIIGGRVIPAFTANAVNDANPVHNRVIEVIAMGSLVAIAILDLLTLVLVLPYMFKVGLLLVAAAAHTVRLLLWQPHKTRHNPLLWMLPAAYAWIPATLFLGALASAGVVSPVAVTHALVVGAVACMMMAMMMRSSLGHTGRELRASRLDIVAYCTLQLAAVLRILAALLSPAYYALFISSSALAWIVAFSLFLIRFGPILVKPRIDGKPG